MIRNIATTLAVVLALTAAASAASPKHRAAGDPALSSHRAAAIRECNEKSARLLQYLWGVQQVEVYQSCVAEQGEMN